MKKSIKKSSKKTKFHPFVPKKSLGQNFLTSPVVPRWMCEAGMVEKGDVVLEIGPGTGTLTREILARGAKVIAIETDKRAVVLLEEIFTKEIQEGRLTIVFDDIRNLELNKLGLKNHSFKIIANIPYYLSGFLLRLFLEKSIQPNTLVFLMQKEVVARVARDPQESILSLSVKAFGTPKYVKTVTRGHFHPAPKVDSAISQISNINQNNFKTKHDQELFFTLLHLGFGQKRKQLLTNLAHNYLRSELETIFQNLEITTTVRAENVPLSLWLKLTTNLAKIGLK